MILKSLLLHAIYNWIGKRFCEKESEGHAPSIQQRPERNLFGILINHTDIWMYLPLSEWFGTKRTFVWFQINQKMVNTSWFQFYLIRFRRKFSVCDIEVDEMATLDQIVYIGRHCLFLTSFCVSKGKVINSKMNLIVWI